MTDMYDFETLWPRPDSLKWALSRSHRPDAPPEAIPLTIADMEFPLAPEIRSGLKAYLDTAVLGYPIVTSSYLDAVVSWMATRHQYTVDPQTIVTTPGVMPALFAAVRAFTRPGDGVIIFTPVYGPFYRAIEASGRRVVGLPLDTVDGRYEINLDRVAKAAADAKTTMMIVCSPHNPGGRVWPRETLAELDRLTRRHGVYVAVDEIHHDWVEPGVTHTVYATLSDEAAANAMMCTAPSKTFNLAGVATSNIIIADDDRRARFQATWRELGGPFVSSLSLKAGELAYRNGAAWLAQAQTVVAHNRAFVSDVLTREVRGIRIYPSEATYLLWADVRSAMRPLVSSRLIVSDGTIFGPGGEGHIRINLALPTAALKRECEAFLASEATRV